MLVTWTQFAESSRLVESVVPACDYMGQGVVSPDAYNRGFSTRFAGKNSAKCE